MLLPHLVQAGGATSGFNTQIVQQPSIWSSIIGGIGAAGAGALSNPALV